MTQQEVISTITLQLSVMLILYYFLPLMLSETVKRKRPFARRRAKSLRPFFVFIRERNPCLLARFLLEG